MARNFIDFLDFLGRIDRLSDREIPSIPYKTYKPRINPMEELDDHEFRQIYRFSKANMLKLIDLVKDDLEGNSRGGHIPVNIQVMAAIRYWSLNELQSDTADMHGFSQPTFSHVSARVAIAFASKSREYIKMPRTIAEKDEVMNGFKRICGFPNVIGAIGCTHIRIQTQAGERGPLYVNSEGYSSINTQLVCDYRFKITDIVARWSGNTPDIKIFNESRIKKRLELNEFQGCLLGDSRYESTNHLYTPVDNPVLASEKKYNKAHIATRQTIDRTIHIWKSRFRILKTGLRGSLENVKVLIVALAVLHNLAIEFKEELDDEELNGSVDSASTSTSSHEDTDARSSFILKHFSNV
ncbi:putative nuclease HARBI1 [Episyrphus balteatus]|uniref:putative nuclease HARBI1 n=1 Tax=Episyrphus balteatus TaxID=286459 RepID=UPI002485D235|nr:putative nuclease HARBI1 [Episyrphus balteatus]